MNTKICNSRKNFLSEFCLEWFTISYNFLEEETFFSFQFNIESHFFAAGNKSSDIE